MATKRTQQRQRDIATFETIMNTLAEEIGNERAVSTNILRSLLDILDFLVEYQHANMAVESILEKEWLECSKYFSDLQSLEADESSKQALAFFVEIKANQDKICRNFKLQL